MTIVIAVAVSSLFVALRLLAAAHGDASRFIVAGSTFTNPAVATGVHVEPGTGYDGQFYYRMARDPVDFRTTAHGVRIDSPLRFQRVTYPAVAFVASGGRAAAVPWMLILVNLAMIGVLAAASAGIALDCGRDPRWGLLIAGFFGLLMSTGRDLTEPTEVACLACGILAMRRQRIGLAVVAFSAAVLSRESAVLVVVAYCVVAAARCVRSRSAPTLRDAALLVPLVVFGAWQFAIRSGTGHFGLSSSTDANLAAFPLIGLLQAVPTWLSDARSASGALRLLEAVTLVVVVAAAARGLRRGVNAAELLAFLFLLFSTVTLSKVFWVESKEFRTLAELWLLAAVLVLQSRRRNHIVVALGLLSFAGVFGFRAFVI